MGGFLKKISMRRWPTLCLVCGVDSSAIKVFLGVVIGGGVLGSVLLFLWACGTKRCQLNDQNANLAIDAEKGGN